MNVFSVIRRICFCLLMSCALTTVCSSQAISDSNNDVFYTQQFINISVEQGLPNNLITAIQQDKFGFLWIGTADGLVRYSGSGFKIYQANYQQGHTLSSNYINDLLIDNEKEGIWVATSSGIDFFDFKTDKFRNIPVAGNTRMESPMRLAKNRSGKLFCGGKWGRLFHLKNDSIRFFQIKNLEEKDNSLLSDIKISKNGVLVQSFNSGLIRFISRKNRSLLRSEEINVQGENRLLEINGELAVCTAEGMFSFDSGTKEFTKLGVQGVTSQNLTYGYQDSKGYLWIGTRENGVYVSRSPIKDLGTDLVFDEYSANQNGTSVYGKTVTYIFEDQTNGIWFGSWSMGLTYTANKRPVVYKLDHNPLVDNTLSYPRVWGLATHGDDLWIGTDGGGINKYNLISGEIEVISAGEKDDQISDPAVVSALSDSKGRLWFGTYNGGVNLYDEKFKTFKKFKASNEVIH